MEEKKRERYTLVINKEKELRNERKKEEFLDGLMDIVMQKWKRKNMLWEAFVTFQFSFPIISPFEIFSVFLLHLFNSTQYSILKKKTENRIEKIQIK